MGRYITLTAWLAALATSVVPLAAQARLWVPVAVAIGASLVLAPVLALLVLSDE